MDKAKVPVENNGAAKPLPPVGQERRSLLGWVRKKVRRIMRRRKRNNDIEIYPLF